MTDTSQQNTILPALPLGRIVDENGVATPTELNFRQALLTNLQNNLGPEGLVAPTQSASNITTIQNSQSPDQITGIPVYSCGYGRILYNSTNNSIMISIDNGSGVPVFKTVTLT